MKCFIIIFLDFSDKGNLQYHFKGVHEVEEVKCDNCGVVCKNKYSLMVHMKTHRKTPCSFCGNMLSAGTLKKHIRSKHTANHLQPHQCQTCKKGMITWCVEIMDNKKSCVWENIKFFLLEINFWPFHFGLSDLFFGFMTPFSVFRKIVFRSGGDYELNHGYF